MTATRPSRPSARSSASATPGPSPPPSSISTTSAASLRSSDIVGSDAGSFGHAQRRRPPGIRRQPSAGARPAPSIIGQPAVRRHLAETPAGGDDGRREARRDARRQPTTGSPRCSRCGRPRPVAGWPRHHPPGQPVGLVDPDPAAGVLGDDAGDVSGDARATHAGNQHLGGRRHRRAARARRPSAAGRAARRSTRACVTIDPPRERGWRPRAASPGCRRAPGSGPRTRCSAASPRRPPAATGRPGTP